MNDLFRRLRWTNIARAAAVLAAVGLLIAWPHLHHGAPALPPAAAAAPPALDTTPAEPDTTTLPEAGPEPPGQRRARARRKTTQSAPARRGARHPSPDHARQHAHSKPPLHTGTTSTPTAVPAPRPARAYAAPAYAPHPEFRP